MVSELKGKCPFLLDMYALFLWHTWPTKAVVRGAIFLDGTISVLLAKAPNFRLTKGLATLGAVMVAYVY